MLDHRRADEKPRRDLLLAKPLVAQRLERTELVQRMQRFAMDVLGERVLLGNASHPHDAGHSLRLRHALLLHEKLKGAIAPAAGRDLEHAGLGTLGVEHRPDIQALQQGAAGDVLGEFLNGKCRPSGAGHWTG